MKLAVVGDPVAHSRSPLLHRGFLAEAGLDGTYEAIRVEAGTLARRLPELHAAGYDGLNVTTPLKEEAFVLCAVADEAATFARAANTLWFDGDAVHGANTDGIGAVAAARASLCGTPTVTGRRDPGRVRPLAGRLVLVLGAGPAARAAAFALAHAGVRLAISARRLDAARALASELALATDDSEIFVLDERRSRTIGIDDAPWPKPGEIDLILSTLPPGATFTAALDGLLAFVPCVIDANYGPRATLGGALGRRDVADGATMLEAQGRASFEIWRARQAVEPAETRGNDRRREGDSNSRDR